MNVSAKMQPKFHSMAPRLNAEQSMSNVGTETQLRSQFIKSSVDGEVNDMPGGHAAQFSTYDYGQNKHMAYDSPLVQPAYSGHGKVRVGTTSAL